MTGDLLAMVRGYSVFGAIRLRRLALSGGLTHERSTTQRKIGDFHARGL